MRDKEDGYIDGCRPPIDCDEICKDITQIDSIHSSNMTKELFAQV